LKLNAHDKTHLLRAGQVGIVFALNYNLDIMKNISIVTKAVKGGDANAF
jgi:xylulokinase